GFITDITLGTAAWGRLSNLGSRNLLTPRFGGSNALEGLRDARNFTPALTQSSLDTCGLHCADHLLEELGPRAVTSLELGGGSYIHTLLAERGGRGLKTVELTQFIERNSIQEVNAFIKRGVNESQLPSLLRRGPLIAHVDGNHYVRVLGTAQKEGATWINLYD